MAKFVSKEDADANQVAELQRQRVTEVLFKNARSGRETVIMEYVAKKMVRRNEGEIIKVLGNTYELKKKRAEKRKQVEQISKAKKG